MNRALQQALLNEFDETEGDTNATSEALYQFGFDRLAKQASFQAVVNRNVVARNQGKTRN